MSVPPGWTDDYVDMLRVLTDANKRAAGRDKDLVDVRLLERAEKP